MTDDTHTADPIDIHVGARMRALRKMRDMSQKELGRACGITFQQIQKYERGTNRISASMLYRAAQALNVAPAWFFEELPVAGEIVDIAQAQTDVKLRQVAEMAREILRLPELSRAARRSICAVITAIVVSGHDAADIEAA